MKKNHIRNGLVLITIVTLVGVSGIALAGPWGGRHMGYGQDAGSGDGCPRYQEGDERRGPGRHMGAGRGAANLTDEQRTQVETLREDFRKATADLRGDIHQRRLALEAELAKKNPDAATAAGLQKELSALRAELDAKRLEHRLEMKKIVP